MLRGGHILPTCGIPTGILTWKWILMALEVLVFWQKQKSSDLGFTFQLSVLKSTQRQRVLAKSVTVLYSYHDAKSSQMAKRMQFSVVGLPHYTIWHLYEPSVDDIHHMEVSTFRILVST